MMPRFEYGHAVRVTRNLRNDGTFPGARVGELLVRRGSTGYVRDVGTFLQDQIVYTVDFVAAGKLVGCREQELQGADEPWVPSRFEFRDKVTPALRLAIDGQVIAAPGDEGEVQKVLRDRPNDVAYHVRFSDRTVQVPETALVLVREAAGLADSAVEGEARDTAEEPR
ncbi:MAG: nitrogen fixation protein NifZ [Rhodobacterales bacterium]|nr:nitrogen fixation protein NifZ [Rhodobacterales bacterium]